MNFRTASIVSIFAFLLVSPALTFPLLDSHTLGHLAVPIISVGGSIIAGKIIGDYLEGRPVFGHNTLIHTTVEGPHHHGKGLLLASPLHGLPFALPHFKLPLF